MLKVGTCTLLKRQLEPDYHGIEAVARIKAIFQSFHIMTENESHNFAFLRCGLFVKISGKTWTRNFARNKLHVAKCRVVRGEEKSHYEL